MPVTTVNKALSLKQSNASITPVSRVETLTRVSQSLMQLGAMLANVADDEVPETLATVKSFVGVLEAAEDNIKRRVVPLLQKRGKKVTDKGTMRLEEGGWILEAQPTRTGYDPKKVEALLRNRGIAVELGMDPKITYSVNEGKLQSLVGNNGGVSADEVELCRFDVSYRIITKKAGE